MKEGFDGTGSKPNVINCICLGSDLDGIVDAMNFPFSKGDDSINEGDRVTTDEYDKLEEELQISMTNCIAEDPFLKSIALDVKTIVRKIMLENGLEFLKRNFN